MLRIQTANQPSFTTPYFSGRADVPERGRLAANVARLAGGLAVRATTTYRYAQLAVTELATLDATRGKYGEVPVNVDSRKVAAAALTLAGAAAAAAAAAGHTPPLPDSYNSLANYLGDTGLMDDPRLHTHRVAGQDTEIQHDEDQQPVLPAEASTENDLQ